MGLIGFAIVGILAGYLAKFLVPGDEGLNWWQTALLGMVGALVGGTLWNVLTGNGIDLEASGFIGAVLGSVILLIGYNYATTRQLKSGSN